LLTAAAGLKCSSDFAAETCLQYQSIFIPIVSSQVKSMFVASGDREDIEKSGFAAENAGPNKEKAMGSYLKAKRRSRSLSVIGYQLIG
jgi:hypothetical protein